MRRATRMDIDRRAQFGEAPRSAGVIEMNVAEKNAADVARFRAEFGERVRNVVEGRLRTGIEKHKSFVRLERRRGNDAGRAQMLGVENVDHGSPCGVRGSYLSIVSQCFCRMA